MIKRILHFFYGKFELTGGGSGTHMREVVKGASTAFVLKLLGAGISFVLSLVLARKLGAEGVGLYYMAFAITTVASVFGRMGLDNTLVRFTSANVVAGDWALLKGLYRKGLSIALVFSIGISLLVFMGATWLSRVVFSKPELAINIKWMSLAIIPVVLYILHGELLRGLKRVRDFQLVRFITVNLLTIPGIYLLAGNWGVKGAVWAYTIGASLTALAGWLIWRRVTPQLSGIRGFFPTDRLLQSSIPLFGLALISLGMGNASTLLLGIWSDSAEVGTFAVAFRASLLINIVLASFNSITAPTFAALHSQGDVKALRSTARNSTVIMALCAAPLYLVFLLIPGRLLSLFGPQFVEASTILAILATGQFISVSVGSVSFLLMMSGHERVERNIVFVAVAVNVALSLILIPRYGALGAAVAFSFSLALKNLLGAFLVHRYLSIKLWSFAKDRPHETETSPESIETSALETPE